MRGRASRPWVASSCAGLLCLLASALAAPAAGMGREVKVDSAALLALAEKLEADGKQQEAGAAYRALEHDPNAQVRAEARFRLARIFKAEGRPDAAAVLLRHVIDEQPAAAPPRIELASVLHQLGDDSAALRELRSLGTLELPLNVARFVDRMSASIKASQPWSFQLEMGLAPDSNINRASTSSTLGTVLGDFTFDEDARQHSGVGATLRGFAQRRVAISRDVDLKAHASLDASLYRRQAFNDVALEVAGGPEFQLGKGRLAAEAGFGQRWYGMHAYERSLRLAGSAWLRVDSVSQLRLDASGRLADNRFNDLEDGHGLALGARYERALSPRLTLAVGAGAGRFKAREDAYSTKSLTFAVNAYRDVGRMTLDVGAEIGWLDADDRLALLPEAREDRLTRFRVGAVFRHLTVAGFAPTTRIVVERNRSTVEFYDYKRVRTEFGISRAF
jgi:hypothetical protein